MTKQKAIAKKCRECAGGTSREVTLCHIFDCPLWEYRTGTSIRSTVYKERIRRAFISCKKEFEELRKMGIDIKTFFPDGNLPLK